MQCRAGSVRLGHRGPPNISCCGGTRCEMITRATGRNVGFWVVSGLRTRLVGLVLVFSTVAVSALIPSVTAFTRVDALTLNAGENHLRSAVVDSAGGYAYVGTETSPGIVVKVRLSDLTRVAGLTLNPGEDGLGGFSPA